MSKFPAWLRPWVYPIAVIGSLVLVVLLALVLSGRGLRGFLAPLDQTNGPPQVTLKTADNDTSNVTLINNLTDTSQAPYYQPNPDTSNPLVPTPVGSDKKYDLFRVQGRIEVSP